MVELFAGALEVQLDDGSWLSGNLGSILLALAAFGAAALAAYVSIHNQGKQLQHDRNLHKREQTRDSIDAAAGAVSDAVLAVHAYVASNARAPKPVSKSQNTELAAEKNRALSAMNAIRTTNVRLELRFGDEHQIVTTHEATRVALETMWKEPAAATEDNDERANAVGNAFVAFRAACHAWFNE